MKMMNELFELFAGAYNSVVPAEYVHRLFFISVICCIVTFCILAGAFIILACVVRFLWRCIR